MPHALLVDVAETMARYGRLRLEKHPVARPGAAHAPTAPVLEEVLRAKKIAGMLGARHRRRHRRRCTRPSAATSSRRCSSSAGRPRTSPATSTARRTRSRSTQDGWHLRAYQREAVECFWHGGSGVVVLPCGAGKTLVGAAAMAQAQATTLILVTNTVARAAVEGRADRAHLADRGRDRRVLRRAQGDPAGHHRDLPGADHAARKGVYPHLELLDARDWGLIIYDEVHLLPAPIFRMTADLQARRRLGLTATLVREDGREGDVFSLIGPKRYDAPWKDIEAQGYIAPADCVEVRVTLPDGERLAYAIAEPEERYRLASCTARTRSPWSSDLGRSSTPASRRW